MGDGADQALDNVIDEMIEEHGHPDHCGPECRLCAEETIAEEQAAKQRKRKKKGAARG
jgi:hypothetical protein